MKAQMDEAIKSDRMKPSEAMRLLDDYERGLKAYTYFILNEELGRLQNSPDCGARNIAPRETPAKLAEQCSALRSNRMFCKGLELTFSRLG